MTSPFHFLEFKGSFLILLFLLFFRGSDILKLILIKKKIFSLIMVSILIINIFSLTPYMLCVSSYLWNNLTLSLLTVFTIIIMRIINNSDKYLAHLLPSNSPVLLWDLLVVLEVISNLIRPLTLSLRLTCNMLTGHVLIGLIAERGSASLLVPLLFFEIGVRVIQSQVYSILVYSYSH